MCAVLAAGLLAGTVAPCFAAATVPPLPAQKPALTNRSPAAMSCADIKHAVAATDDMILKADGDQDNSEHTRTGINVAKTVGSFLVGSVGGVVGIMAAGHFMSDAASDRAENAEEAEQTAREQRSRLEGIYMAKECAGNLPALPDYERTASATEPSSGARKEEAGQVTLSRYNQ